MTYAIRQSYWNNNGKKWVKTLDRRYESQDRAQHIADHAYQWIAYHPVTSKIISVSSSEVIEIKS